MKKTPTRRNGTEAGNGSKEVEVLRPIALTSVLVDLNAQLRELAVSTGLQVLAAMLEQDRTALCGIRSRPEPDRAASRHGYDTGQVVLGGRKVQVRKPRVRGPEGEMELSTWARMTEEDVLSDRAVEQMLVGVSTRRYSRSLEELPEGTRSRSTSRSTVSRRFVARTGVQVSEFLASRLDALDIAVVMVDGTYVGDHVVLVALGIAADGTKHVLGLREGTTENEAVCRSLFAELIERGLAADVRRLFVIDGGKGLRKAIRTTFGAAAMVQRCQVHKTRNVLDHLPERDKGWVRSALRRAWASDDAEQARRRLHALARQLESRHPSAAGSVREGLDETLTVLELGLSGALLRSLRSTNPIENLQGLFKRAARNVKRWRGGDMAVRWAGAALIDCAARFRRLRGHKDLARLIVRLRSADSAPKEVKAA